VNSSWPIDPARLRRLTIGWPARYTWPPADNWLRTIRGGIRSHSVTVDSREIAQPTATGAVAILEAETGRNRERVVIDFEDHPRVDAELAADAALYFKLNYATAGYPQENVVPGGYVPANPLIYRRLLLLRALRGRPRFAWDVYGRFGLRSPSESRRRAVEILSARSDFRYEGSLFRYPGGPDKVPYRKYLRETTRAKVCVDMPGQGDLTFRLADYLALGACVVRPRLEVELPVPLVDGEHVAYCAPDLSDLAEVCGRLVRHEGERERIARNARRYFDRYLHRRQLAAYYLHEICKRLLPVLGLLIRGMTDNQPGLLPF
jgi:hypothetical protein